MRRQHACPLDASNANAHNSLTGFQPYLPPYCNQYHFSPISLSLDCLFPFLVYAQLTFDFIHYDFPLFGGNFLLNSIQSWALKEAKERLEARGEEYQYKPKSA